MVSLVRLNSFFTEETAAKKRLRDCFLAETSFGFKTLCAQFAIVDK